MATDSDLTTTQIATTRKKISPYDLSPNDNPGIVISKPILKGPNYDEWVNNLRLTIKARKKFGFADGTIPQPSETSEDLEVWIANNALVVSSIKLTISENIAATMSHIDDSHELWKHIQTRFGLKNGQWIQRLKAELVTCKQKGIAVEAYYGKLSKLWRKLSDYQQAKTMEELRKEREEDKLHQYFMGLDETMYGAVKSALLSRVPLPTIEEAYNVVIQDEESKSLGRMDEDRNDGVSFAVQTTNQTHRYTGEKGGQIVCSYFSKTGHIVENCFKRIGYPPWFDDRSRGKTGAGRGSANVSGGGKGSARTKSHDGASVNYVSQVQNTGSVSYGLHTSGPLTLLIEWVLADCPTLSGKL